MGGSADVSGLKWAGTETVGLPTAALTAKVLCRRHNSALSPLDAEAGRLFEVARDADEVLADDATHATSSFDVINGPDIQRWLLKCLLGAASSGGLETSEIRSADRCVGILFGEATWPPGWGLYLSPNPEGDHAFNGVGFMTLLRPDGSITGLVANVAGLRLVLALGRPDGDPDGFHPAGVHFSHGDRPATRTLAFGWPQRPGWDFVNFTRSAPYDGRPINHF